MEAAISAVTGELLNRLISFLIRKYTNHACLEENLERPQLLLLRAQTVVEAAEGRYITNSGTGRTAQDPCCHHVQRVPHLGHLQVQ